MNKEQFRKLVEGLDLENTVYVIFNPRPPEKVEKIIYSTPRETYIYANLKESYNGKFHGFGIDDWYFDKVDIDENGYLQFAPVTDELRIHSFRYRNIPINIPNEGRGWQISTKGATFILNIGMRKWMNWDKEPWSDLK